MRAVRATSNAPPEKFLAHRGGLTLDGPIRTATALTGNNQLTLTMGTISPNKNPDKQSAGQVPRDPRLVCAAELDQLPPLEWLIPGKILRRGLNVIFGSSETCKTLIIIYWALLIAQTHTVVIIVGEGLHGLDQRIKAAADYYSLCRDNLYVWKEPVALMRPEVIKSFVGAVAPLKPVLVIADTLARCMVGGDESSTRDMGIAVHSCGLISHKLDDCSMALVHHKGRRGPHERGSTALRGAADYMIEMNRKDSIVMVRCSKAKDDEKTLKEQYKIIKHLNSVVLEKQGELDVRSLKILQMLTQGDMRHGEIQAATKIPAATVTRLLAKLKTEKYISVAGDCYNLLKKGRDKLGPSFTVPSAPAESETSKDAETSGQFHSAPERETGVNGKCEKDISGVVFHVSHDDSQCPETETPLCSTHPPPYKGEVEQVEGRKNGTGELDSSPLLSWGWSAEEVARMPRDEVEQILATFTV